jgi:hypothetical protein
VVIVLRLATVGLAGPSYNTAENFSIAQWPGVPTIV